MALTKINGNNIDTTTEALIKILQLSGSGSYLELPKYTNQTAIDSAFASPAIGWSLIKIFMFLKLFKIYFTV